MPLRFLALGWVGLLAALGSSAWPATGSALSSGQNEAHREAPDGESPARERLAERISFIDSPSATCYALTPGRDECFLQWEHLSVSTATPDYLIELTLTIDGAFRAIHSGFFQRSIYVPADFYQPGFRVDCGRPGDSGDPTLGLTHSYAVRARDTKGLSAANYGVATCPAVTWIFEDDFESSNLSAWSDSPP